MGEFTWEVLVALMTGLVSIVIAALGAWIAFRQRELGERMEDLELNRDRPLLVPDEIKVEETRQTASSGTDIPLENRMYLKDRTYTVRIRNARSGPALAVEITSITVLFSLSRPHEVAADLESLPSLITIEVPIAKTIPMIWQDSSSVEFTLPADTWRFLEPQRVTQMQGSYRLCFTPKGMSSSRELQWNYVDPDSQHATLSNRAGYWAVSLQDGTEMRPAQVNRDLESAEAMAAESKREAESALEIHLIGLMDYAQLDPSERSTRPLSMQEQTILALTPSDRREGYPNHDWDEIEERLRIAGLIDASGQWID